MKKQWGIEVQGTEHRWSFSIEATEQDAQDWRVDGLEVSEIRNTIPLWLPVSLLRPWCFVQDIFYFRNPFK